MNKMKFESPDMVVKNIERIAELFPNCVTEMLAAECSTAEHKVYKKAVNFELLKQMLSGDVVDGDEAYEFTWVGKKAAIVEANKPIRKTLRPCPEESKNWDTTENLYIEGDNLEVLKLLQESYLGKVKMIYIDPPYNTGNDFIYADDFMRSQEEENAQMCMYDEDDNRLFKNTDTNGRFHSDWCSMIYSRLMLARNLLTDDGVIFISINDCERDNIKKCCDEIYGECNFISTMIWQQRKGGGNDSKYVATDHEYVLLYARNAKYLPEKWRIPQSTEYLKRYKEIDEQGNRYYWDTIVRNGLQSPIVITLTTPDGNEITLNSQWSKDKVLSGLKNGEVRFTETKNGWSLHHRVYMKEGQVLRSLLTEYGNNRSAGQELVSLFDTSYFDYAKPTTLIKLLLQLCTKEDIVLDFFSGSATTAHAVMQLNAEDGGHRKFIMVQLPESCDEKSEAYKAGYKNICEIGKERIRRAGEKIKSESPMTTGNLDVGFRVLKLDDTNMKDVYYAPDEYDQNLLSILESNIKEDRNDLDLLFGCLLDWGLPLSLPYSFEQIDGCTVHTYNDGDLIACFDDNIPESVIKGIAKRKPHRAVFRDSGFASSPEKINVFEIFKLYMPEDANDISKRVKVI